MSSVGVIAFVALCPVLWQVPRTFWPVRLNADGTRFTGLYRRYSVETFTGYVSDVRESTSEKTVGSVSASTFGTAIGNTYQGTTTISDGRRTFTTFYTDFFLTDQAGKSRTVSAVNVRPSIGAGHLATAAWLVHNGKEGNAFVVYNHTTGEVWMEKTHVGVRMAKRGLVKMVMRLPTAYVVILCLSIVGIPLVILLGLGAEWQLKIFNKWGVKPLVAALHQRANGLPSRAAQASASVPSQKQPDRVIDLAQQVKEITELHDSGALTNEEFQAAKTKLLGG